MSSAENRRVVRKGLPAIAWILTGLMAFSAYLVVGSRQSEKVIPSVENNGPSGVKVFAELLRREGHPVVVSKREVPLLQDGDLLIKFDVDTRFYQYGYETEEDTLGVAHRSLYITVDRRFDKLSTEKEAESTIYWSMVAEHEALYSVSESIGAQLESTYYYPLWENKTGAQVGVQPVDGRPVFEMLDGHLFTNRFIDKAQNAQFVMAVINGIQKPGGRIVFSEWELGNRGDVSVWQDLGDHVSVAYWQFLFLLLVVFYTLGRRFGPLVEDVFEVRSSKDLLNAFGDLMYRAKKTELALQLVLDHADVRARRALNLSLNATEKDRDQRLEPEVVRAFAEVRLLQASKGVPPREAAKAVGHLLNLVEGLERSARSRRLGVSSYR